MSVLLQISGFINDVAISGSHADGITLNGNITTAGDSNDSAGGASVDAGGDVVLTGKVFLGTDITIDAGDSTGNDGVVTFSSTVDGGSNLDLLSGTGKVDIVGDLELGLL